MRRLVYGLGIMLAAAVSLRGAGDGPLPGYSLTTIPRGLPKERPTPKDNPLTEAKVQLGRQLFFDPILSADGTVSCSSCHDPAYAFSDRKKLSEGLKAQRTARHAPTLWNRAYGSAFFWDGRAMTLEEQALMPIASPNEMGSSVALAIERLRKHDTYPKRFREAFGEEVSAASLARALASYERVLLTGDTRADRFRTGDAGALTDLERHGLWLYESRSGCWKCHPPPHYTDDAFHNTGVGWGSEPLDQGRYMTTHREADKGKFKTATLRALLQRGPYMHDGSLQTLEDVVAFYNRGGNKNPNLDSEIKPLGLTPEEVKALVAYLKTLSQPR